MNSFLTQHAVPAVTIICAILLFTVICFAAFAIYSRKKNAAETQHALERLGENFRNETERSREAIRREIADFRNEMSRANESRTRTLNESLSSRSRETNETLAKQSSFIAGTLAENRNEISIQLTQIRESSEKSAIAMREENSKKLEEMRGVVEEKLQTTLETRIGESFKLVSAQLENVNKSLGEMQNIATSVGDLSRLLTNVKRRGTWGEVQLGTLLEDMLSAGQFERNVQPDPKHSNAIVEFAVKLPGGAENDNKPVYLPIDSKFPIESYDKLMKATEASDPKAAETAGKELERAIKKSAADISEKYIKVPYTTNFAVLFLPTEGLYAEVIRRPELAEKIQKELRVLIAGPTTLSALLTSFQMGFRTLAIQKNSAEIAKTLSVVKKEFATFGALLDKVSKKLDEAQTSMQETTKRYDNTTKKLDKVEALDVNTEEKGENTLTV